MTVPQTTAPTGPEETRSSTPNVEEHQYLELVREILDEGELRRDRYALLAGLS